MTQMPVSKGILVIDKGPGPTSHDIVAQIRRIIGIRKIGHCGTLDPLATGVLVLCFGVYTRLSDNIAWGEKQYATQLRLGEISNTADADGVIEEVVGAIEPTEDSVNEIVGEFRGEIEQVPPAHSAIKIGGIRSYELARRNQAVELSPRRVLIRKLEVRDYSYPVLELDVVCSKGTYIRSLGSDIGNKLGCGAHVTSLRRTRVGNLDLSMSVSVDQIQNAVDGNFLDSYLVPVSMALSALPNVSLSPDQVRVFFHGGTVKMPAPIGEGFHSKELTGSSSAQYAVYDKDNSLCGLGTWVDEKRSALRPLKVLMDSENGIT